MKILETYIGIDAFGVKVDETPELMQLSEKAKSLRELPFEKKLEAVKTLALESMVNAYEGMIQNPSESERNRFKELVFYPHSLGEALQQGRNMGTTPI